jgi:hypothetical protein
VPVAEPGSTPVATPLSSQVVTPIPNWQAWWELFFGD